MEKENSTLRLSYQQATSSFTPPFPHDPSSVSSSMQSTQCRKASHVHEQVTAQAEVEDGKWGENEKVIDEELMAARVAMTEKAGATSNDHSVRLSRIESLLISLSSNDGRMRSGGQRGFRGGRRGNRSTRLASPLPLAMPRDLHKEDYFHGLLPRLDAEDLLLSKGDCMVRMSHDSPSVTPITERDYILSICVEPGSAKVHWRRPGFEPLPKIVKHVYINRMAEGRYNIGNDNFESIQSLIAYYTTTPITNKNIHANPLFLTPVGRQPWQLEQEEVHIGRLMRSGPKRDIHYGSLHTRNRCETDVTIKLIKPQEMRKESVKEMMHEVRSLLQCRSPFIMRLHGVTVLAEPGLMVMEQASEFLSSFLERNTTMSEAAKIDLCYQSSLAIAYTHSLDFVLRNIAARNFFYCNGKVKFGDFSLARRLQSQEVIARPSSVSVKPRRVPSSPASSSGSATSITSPSQSFTVKSKSISTSPTSRSMSASVTAATLTATLESTRTERKNPTFRDTSALALPLRWRAPESLLYTTYSQKSDCWAFGVLCWEIYHAGRKPLAGMNSGEVQHFILSGQHLVFESMHAPVKQYIMEKIFAESPDDRFLMEESAKMFEFFLSLEGKKTSSEKTDSKEKVGNSKEKEREKG